MAVHSLKPATDRCLGGPLPRQLANQTRAHPVPPEFSPQRHAAPRAYAVLAAVSGCCPPVQGRLPTRYSPVRHSVIPDSIRKLPPACFVRLACVRHAASVHPEPGSNSHVKVCLPQRYVPISFWHSSVFTVAVCHASLPWFARPHRGMCVSGRGILKIFKDCVILC